MWCQHPGGCFLAVILSPHSPVFLQLLSGGNGAAAAWLSLPLPLWPAVVCAWLRLGSLQLPWPLQLWIW